MPYHNIRNFSLGEMAECTGAIRRMGSSSDSMQSLAEHMATHFYYNFRESSGTTQFALCRVFRTESFAGLAEEQKAYASRSFDTRLSLPAMKCMVLEGTKGDLPEWSQPGRSQGHWVIPLPSEKLVTEMPMISALISDFGLRIKDVLEPPESLFIGKSEEDYNIFLVAQAEGSQVIPAQTSFVQPHQIKSVLGFGGMLPSGNLFATILFSKVVIRRDVADMFRCIALASTLSMMKFDKTHVPSQLEGTQIKKTEQIDKYWRK